MMPSRHRTHGSSRQPISQRVEHVLILLALSSTALLPTLVFGQTISAPTSSANTLDAVTVVGDTPLSTPTPRAYAGDQVARGGQAGLLGNLDNMESPFVLTSYTAKLIEDQQARTLGDVLKNDSSVQVTRGYGNSSDAFTIRGLPMNNDDLSFNGLYGILPRQVLPIEMVERVEVLKGASAFVNGAAPAGSALGGQINIQPKRGTDDPFARVNLDYSTQSRVGGGVDISRRFGPDNVLGIRVNAAHRDGESAVHDENRRVTLATVGLDYRGERLRLSLDAGYQKIRDDDLRPGVLVNGIVPDVPSRRGNYGQSFTYSELESTYGVIRGEYDLSDNWMTYAAVGTSRDREKGEYSTVTVNDVNGSGTQGRLGVPFQRDSISGEVGLRGRVQTGSVSHRLNLGVSALKTTKRAAYTGAGAVATNINDPVRFPYPANTFTGGNVDNPNITGRTTLKSVALSDTLGLFEDRILLTVGARHQSLRDEGYDYVQNKTGDYDKSITSPMVGVVLRATDSISVYANRTEGLSAGGVAPIEANNRGEVLSPARTKQYEGGLKFDYGTFGGNIGVFQIEKPQDALNVATLQFARAGQQRNRGIELNVYGEAVKGVRLLGGITLLNAKLNNTPNGVNEGNRAPGVPNYQATLGAEYDLPSLPGLTVGAFVVRKGSQYIDIANRAKIDPSTRLDLNARYATKVSNHNVVWRLGIDNVTNRNYWESVGSSSQLMQSLPRTYKLSMSVDF